MKQWIVFCIITLSILSVCIFLDISSFEPKVIVGVGISLVLAGIFAEEYL